MIGWLLVFWCSVARIACCVDDVAMSFEFETMSHIVDSIDKSVYWGYNQEEAWFPTLN